MNYANPTTHLRDTQLVSVIGTVCAGLELTAAQEEAAKRCYEGAGDWLARSDDPLLSGISIGLQGLVGLACQTTAVTRRCWASAAIAPKPDR